MVSLTGAVVSKSVTETHKSKFKLDIQVFECNGIYLLDCKTNKSNRDESRS